MRSFSIQTLGCKVNQYETEQLATLLRSHGLCQVDGGPADLRIINTCSVTVDAASKSRQLTRRAARDADSRVIVTGCWATSNPTEARQLDGVDAVLTHHGDVAGELRALLSQWSEENTSRVSQANPQSLQHGSEHIEPLNDIQPSLKAVAGQEKGWITLGRTPVTQNSDKNKPYLSGEVKEKAKEIGTRSLPLLQGRQGLHQRAFLKIQDGCDAHCTYCIIPSLRPRLWSKPEDDVLQEARQMVEAGHVEIVLTGIFLSAYGQSTALRRRQTGSPALGELIRGLCMRVPGLLRLRLSSLEPGDLTRELLEVLRDYPQVVPHFHLPLQSGSDLLLRRMNRQYGRDDFLLMLDRVHAAFDRPALTTDIIAGFPGETDEEFEQTIGVVEQAKFIHIHAFPFSPRPGTAAARWTEKFVHGPVVGERIDRLREMAEKFSLEFRETFVGTDVELLVEREADEMRGPVRHGRCERYFDVHFESDEVATGDLARVRIDRATPGRTFGTLVEIVKANRS